MGCGSSKSVAAVKSQLQPETKPKPLEEAIHQPETKPEPIEEAIHQPETKPELTEENAPKSKTKPKPIEVIPQPKIKPKFTEGATSLTRGRNMEQQEEELSGTQSENSKMSSDMQIVQNDVTERQTTGEKAGKISQPTPGPQGTGASQEKLPDDLTPVKLTVEERTHRFMEVLQRLQNAPDYFSEDLDNDFEFLISMFPSSIPNDYPKPILDAIEHGGLVEVCLKILKIFFESDFLLKENAAIWQRMKKVIVVFWNGSDKYIPMNEHLMKLNAHEYFLKVLQHPKIIEVDDTKLLQLSRQLYMIKALFGYLHNMLMYLGESARTAFRNLNAVNILKTHLESKNTMIRVKAFINLAYLINEEENELINAGDTQISYIVDILRDALASPNRRSKKGFSALETVEALNKLAVNDNNKVRIQDSGALECYQQLLMEGVTEAEQIVIVHGIWTFAFHEKCRETINAMPALVSRLKEFSASENKQLVKVSKGALWVLEGGHAETKTDSEDVQHIMISYNWGVKPTALKIRDRLLQTGFKVWMDVDNMTGSTLEAMAEAVEKSAVVVICMTRKYKESPSCRTEAEYTYQLRKPFIPLRLEAGYKADGWLGIMMGTKLWFDFVKNFESATVGLIKELGNCGSLSAAAPVLQGHQAPSLEKSPALISAAYKSWSTEEVSTWLKENDLGHKTPKLSELDGSLLHELAEMKRDAPDFFYASLRDDLKFTVFDILKFTKAMKKL